MENSRKLFVAWSAEARLEAARRWIEALPRDAEVLVLASHAVAADAIVHSVVTDGGSRFGVHRFTPNRLASRLAAPELARRSVVPATSLSLSAIAARAAQRVVEQGTAGRLKSVVERPGFPQAMARTYVDLREAGVAVDKLTSSNLQIAPFVQAIEQELNEARIADRTELYEIGITAISDQGVSPAGMPVLLLDLAMDVSIEQHLVAALVTRSPHVLATAAYGDRPAVEVLTGMLGVAPEEPAAEKSASSLTNLQRHLFEASAPIERSLDGSVSLASWPGEARECVEIARQMQFEAAKGLPFDRMAVLLRAPVLYRAHLEEALRRASIPAWFARGTTQPDPSGRALLALLACAAEGLTARRFAEYLSLSQVPEPGRSQEDSWAPPESDLPLAVPDLGNNAEGARGPSDRSSAPDAPTIDGNLRAPWRWERLLVDAAVIGGADRWRRRLAGLQQELALRRGELGEDEAGAGALDRTADDLEHLQRFALPLIEQLAELPRQATWEEWLARVRDLAVSAIRDPTGVVRVLTELEPLRSVGPVDLWNVQHVLAPRLRELSVPPESRPNGAVCIAPVEMARGIAFEVVFVPGLAEKLFPQRILQDPLLSDDARTSLGAAGLATQNVRVARERLTLRLAASAATRYLSLSWPRIEIENARARVPSFYALEAMRAAEGHLPGLDELTNRAEGRGRAYLGWPAPEKPEDAIDDTEYDLAVLARLKDTDPATSVGAAAYLLNANVHLARALRARARRWRKPWSVSDGLVDPDTETLQALARHRLGERAYSATALESFAVCPYRFFLQAIHQLKPREEIAGLETLDPLTRGALIHEVQFRLLSALRDQRQLPLEPRGLEVAFEQLDMTVTRVAAEYSERLAPAILRVWDDAIEAIRLDLREWLRQLAADGPTWTPRYFELSFGLPRRLRRNADPASVAEPVKVLDSVSLRGSIDLIERRADGVLRVTDHKTGKAQVPEGVVVHGGKTLQPLLYALVAETLFKAPVESGRLYYCTANGEFAQRPIPLDEASRIQARTALDLIGRAIEQGFLPAAPMKDACDTCNYRIVCGPHETVRVSRKRRERVAELHSLRELP
jgi:RecB family exonuclease